MRWISLYKECNVSWNGNKRHQIEIGKDIFNFFSEKEREIEIEIDGTIYNSHLPDSFFSKCKHLRTAYAPGTKSPNQLHNWISLNDIKKVKLEVIEKPIRFKLIKLK
jgi:hypothetical protein